MGFGIKSITKGIKKVGGGMIGATTGAVTGGLKGGFKGAARGAVRGGLPSSFVKNAVANRNASAGPSRAPPAPYKPIPIPNYSQDMQRFYQMTNNSVPAVQRLNPGMIQRGGYQGPTFVNDRPQTSLQQYNRQFPAPPQAKRHGIVGAIKGSLQNLGGRSSGPRPMVPGRGLSPQVQPNMSLNPNAGPADMMGPRPLMIR